MANTLPDDGFYYDKEAPASPAEAAANSPAGQEVTVTKSALQGYISSWLDPNNKTLRSLLSQYAPRAMQFTLDRPGPRNVHFATNVSWESDDPSKRKVQLGRFLNTVKERALSIVIIDGGFENTSPGLGEIQGASQIDANTYAFSVATTMKITVEVYVAAQDESTTNDLCSFLAAIFGNPLRRFGGGNHITVSERNVSHQITLPFQSSFSSVSRGENITEDPTDTKWVSSTSLELMYDAATVFQTGHAIRGGYSGIGSLGGTDIGEAVHSSDTLKDNAPTIQGSVSVKVGRPARYRLVFDGEIIIIPSDWSIVLSDHRLARWDAVNWTLTPRMTGSIELRLVDNQRETDDNGHIHRRVLARLSITIKP